MSAAGHDLRRLRRGCLPADGSSVPPMWFHDRHRLVRGAAASVVGLAMIGAATTAAAATSSRRWVVQGRGADIPALAGTSLPTDCIYPAQTLSHLLAFEALVGR